MNEASGEPGFLERCALPGEIYPLLKVGTQVGGIDLSPHRPVVSPTGHCYEKNAD